MATSYKQSIRKKLTLLFTATACITVLIACTTLWVYEFVSYRSTLRTEETATAKLIAQSSAPALVFGDAAAANETLSLLRADPRILTACLYDKRSVVMGRYASAHNDTVCPAAASTGWHFTRRHLFLVEGIAADEQDPAGSLFLDVSLEEMYAQLLRFAETGLCVSLLSTLFAFVLASMLQHVISRPILHLTEIATQVSRGGSYLLRAERISDDETGVLMEQFNIMMERIQQREEELRAAHDGLETKVEERTRDLEAAKLAAEESNRAKSAFLANMSHELRTPLNAIIGYSEMLYEDALDAGNSAEREDLEKILRSARHLLRLISDILDLSKIEAGQMSVECEPVLTSDLLQDVITTGEVLVKKNRNVLATVQPLFSGMMNVDVLRFRQCLLNLLGNACKFTEDGTISFAIERTEEEGVPWILWRIRDTGVGISAEDHAKLFRTFSQVDGSATRRFGGSGLGLAISQQLCQKMGGRITLESELGKGSTFTIHIPEYVATAQQVASQEEELVWLPGT